MRLNLGELISQTASNKKGIPNAGMPFFVKR